MFYLKYRPQRLADIDNEERRILLTKLFSENKSLPHAFLLTGPKGTGKTSTARIIAKVLNCEANFFAGKSETPEPCGECASCVDIAKNRFFDVYELDAASNRGIDDIRSLKEQMNFVPVKGRYKIYIIDEVHMLTKEAFNALLKTLEEPPEFVIFVLATTEKQKLPETILSRCLNINFNKATAKELLYSLKRIVNAEKLTVSEAALEKIALKAKGSFRDAAKILETLVKSTNLSDAEIEAYLKGNINEEPIKLLEYLFAKKDKEAFEFITGFSNQGGSSAWLIEELLNLLHDLLLTKKGLIETNFPKNFQEVTAPQISHLIKELLEAYQQLKYCPVEDLPLLNTLSQFLLKNTGRKPM